MYGTRPSECLGRTIMEHKSGRSSSVTKRRRGRPSFTRYDARDNYVLTAPGTYPSFSIPLENTIDVTNNKKKPSPRIGTRRNTTISPKYIYILTRRIRRCARITRRGRVVFVTRREPSVYYIRVRHCIPRSIFYSATYTTVGVCAVAFFSLSATCE